MARIAINDIQESESFLTELNHTDVAMDQINGGTIRLGPLGRFIARAVFIAAVIGAFRNN
ncbi:MAG: hypothetical protein F6K65_13975 [Moorea sp. SIO3C2]|nr:hypothetical protein [Moorena sp. SIO3C2]